MFKHVVSGSVGARCSRQLASAVLATCVGWFIGLASVAIPLFIESCPVVARPDQPAVLLGVHAPLVV